MPSKGSAVEKLSGYHRRHLKGLAHHLDAIIQVGTKGVTDNLVAAIDDALERHELIKIRFDEFKDEKEELSQKISERTSSEIIGSIGNVVILFRYQADGGKRNIELPSK